MDFPSYSYKKWALVHVSNTTLVSRVEKQTLYQMQKNHDALKKNSFQQLYSEKNNDNEN